MVRNTCQLCVDVPDRFLHQTHCVVRSNQGVSQPSRVTTLHVRRSGLVQAISVFVNLTILKDLCWLCVELHGHKTLQWMGVSRILPCCYMIDFNKPKLIVSMWPLAMTGIPAWQDWWKWQRRPIVVIGGLWVKIGVKRSFKTCFKQAVHTSFHHISCDG